MGVGGKTRGIIPGNTCVANVCAEKQDYADIGARRSELKS